MKIKKNEFQQRQMFSSNLEEQIERVINPFEPQILNRNLKIFIAKNHGSGFFNHGSDSAKKTRIHPDP